MGAAVPVVVLATLLGFVAWLLLYRQRRMMGGFWLWEQRRMRREGIAARARVISRLTPGRSSTDSHLTSYEYVLEIEAAEGKPAYRVSASNIAYWTDNDAATKEGALVPVRIDRADPERVMVDFEELWAARKKSRDAELAAKRERQRALLDGKDDH